ncbi:MAG: SprT-like domain-containing protein [Coxiellaceae bacterium]|nr:SprT-like domain-containing protein [Coxiellaceae bacterium]
MTPSEEFYAALQTAYDHFNADLFDCCLPPVLFTIQRQHGMMGYFSPDRWASSKGKNCHEIAINPIYVGRATLIELMQTLVHEMAHCWQHCHGKPGRMSYHNKEWSDKMVSVGLMPSTTGMPGGKRVGQHMNDYPIREGKFIQACVSLLKKKKFTLPWVDRFSTSRGQPDSSLIDEHGVISEALSGLESGLANQLTINLTDLFGGDLFISHDTKASKKVKVKYSCSECGVNVWGKSDLSLRCDDCDNTMDEY